MTNPTTIYDKRSNSLSLFVILITPLSLSKGCDITIVLLPHHNKTWGSEKATTIIGIIIPPPLGIHFSLEVIPNLIGKSSRKC